MQRLLCAVAAIALIAPVAATAQSQNQNRAEQTRPSQNRPSHNRPSHSQPSQNRPPQNRPPENRPPENRPSQPSQNRPNHNRPNQNRPNRPETRPNHPSTLPTYRPGHRPSTFRRYRAPAFHYPHGWRYRRWHTGLVLPHLFLSSPYFWTNWAVLGLGPPPPGFVWVRYGPDLLLVNRHTGRIADVIYGAFY